MPSVLSPIHPTSSKSYAPLADEVNPPFGHTAPAPTVTRNGTIVYGGPAPAQHRTVSSSSAASSSADSDDLQRVGAQMRNDSEETLSPSVSRKGKEREVFPPVDGRGGGYPQDYVGVSHEEGGDLGEMRRGSYKGKERAWDVEQGRAFPPVHEETEVNGENGGAYPPLNEAEAEEKRIQDNLARFAAKDMARRRAARESRLLAASPGGSNPSSPRSSMSVSSAARRPLSFMGTANKRSSMMGLVEGLWSGGAKKDEPELPMAHPRGSHEAPYANPYDTQPTFSPAPRMTVSPTSASARSPFADPISGPSSSTSSPSAPAPPPLASASNSRRRPSLISPSPHDSPRSAGNSPLTSPTDSTGFAYGGPTWRGGQAQAVADNAQEGDDVDPPRRRGPERWWHALCAWGDDLDGGHDDGNGRGNQAGRTNPFE
ncbi:hypothetical protein IAT38_000365 [Cryptococcus sp. DSM 104549]